MQLHSSRLGLALSFLVAVSASPAARAQTDVALSVYGTFTGTTNYNGGLEHQKAVDTLGGMFELRHISSPLIGYEGTYSFNRANQEYWYTGGVPAGFPPGIFVNALSANAHQITGDWVFSAHAGNFRPFALAGAGLRLNEPASGQSQTKSASEPVYVYGFGVDWKIVPHFGLRLQYRGNLYKAPAISTAFGSNGSLMHTAEPTIGAYIKF